MPHVDEIVLGQGWRTSQDRTAHLPHELHESGAEPNFPSSELGLSIGGSLRTRRVFFTGYVQSSAFKQSFEWSENKFVGFQGHSLDFASLSFGEAERSIGNHTLLSKAAHIGKGWQQSTVGAETESRTMSIPPASVGARNEGAIQLLRSWIAADASVEGGVDSWNKLKQELDKDRPSGRRLFP